MYILPCSASINFLRGPYFFLLHLTYHTAACKNTTFLYICLIAFVPLLTFYPNICTHTHGMHKDLWKSPFCQFRVISILSPFSPFLSSLFGIWLYLKAKHHHIGGGVAHSHAETEREKRESPRAEAETLLYFQVFYPQKEKKVFFSLSLLDERHLLRLRRPRIYTEGTVCKTHRVCLRIRLTVYLYVCLTVPPLSIIFKAKNFVILQYWIFSLSTSEGPVMLSVGRPARSDWACVRMYVSGIYANEIADFIAKGIFRLRRNIKKGITYTKGDREREREGKWYENFGVVSSFFIPCNSLKIKQQNFFWLVLDRKKGIESFGVERKILNDRPNNEKNCAHFQSTKISMPKGEEKRGIDRHFSPWL